MQMLQDAMEIYIIWSQSYAYDYILLEENEYKFVARGHGDKIEVIAYHYALLRETEYE